MPTYPEPADNPKCTCPGHMASFFCATGHMLECHAPHSCTTAGCGHLAQYTEDPEMLAELWRAAIRRLREGDLDGYRLDGERVVVDVLG